jgi:alpha-1,2-mannosyltransferase
MGSTELWAGIVGPVQSAFPRPLRGFSVRRRPATGLLIAGVIAFAAILASYLAYRLTHPYNWTSDPVDLRVYRSGGLIVRHIRPDYNPHLAAPLYDWPGYSSLHLKFTYPPFAAVLFAVVSFIPWSALLKLTDAANAGLLVAALWFTFGGLGYRRSRQMRLGGTLLAAAAVFWTEPVIRTIYIGQVNLALMALILWDLCQRDTSRSRWWKGAGVGIAAGIKLIPLIFILYLLVTRKFRQAAVACAVFAATVAAGFAFLPADSATWWFGGLFVNGAGRTGFVGWMGNQSLRGLMTRLMGSVAGSEHAWLVVAVATVVTGLLGAALLDRNGHLVPGILTCALTGLLVSPISWDHHWVWIAPGVAVAAHYAVQAMAGGARGAAPGQPGWPRWAARVRGWAASRPAWGYWALAAGMLVVYGAWPGGFWGKPLHPGPFNLGMLWVPPNTGMRAYDKFGDLPSYAEYHWHGSQFVLGNAFVLGGLVLFGILVVLAWIAPAPRPALPQLAAARPPGAGPERLKSRQGASLAAVAPRRSRPASAVHALRDSPR